MIGLIGLGRMGTAIAARLRERGRELIAWDRDAARVQAAAGYGALPAVGPREVAARADTVLSIITEDAGARGVWEGENGFLQAGLAGKLFVEMSTLQPMTVRTLAAHAAARGAAFVDSPVLGSIPSVRQGKLVALVGGAGADLARARGVLEDLAVRIEHVGPVGAGAAMKLVVNNMMGCYIQVLSESLMLGRSQGLPLDRMIEIIGGSVNASGWFQMKKPALLGARNDVTLDIRTLRKDILSVLATAALGGVPTPAAAATAASLSAAVHAGAGERDIAELVAFLCGALPQTW